MPSSRLRQEFWRKNTIVFSTSQADTLRLWRTHISADWTLGETAEEVTNGPEDHGFAAASSTDDLLFASTVTRQNLWALPVASKEAGVTGPRRLVTDGAQPDALAGVSLDGDTLSFTPAGSGGVSVRMMDLKSRETS